MCQAVGLGDSNDSVSIVINTATIMIAIAKILITIVATGLLHAHKYHTSTSESAWRRQAILVR